MAHRPDVSITQNAEKQFQTASLNTVSLGKGVFLFSGDGANIVAVTDDATTVLVDSGIAPRVDELAQALANTTHGPVTCLINTSWHFDHTGDLSLFPRSAELIVGPAFISNELLMPGYPTNKRSAMMDSDFEGREVREIEFSNKFKIGQFQAHDLLGDGSFYVLNVPGHAVGHISGLARTTPDTFVFMGGDVCHFGGSFRPTIYKPLPAEISVDIPLDKKRFRLPYSCSMFTSCHPLKNESEEKARTTPYYQVTTAEGSWYIDPPTAQDSINKLEEFDADPNVFVCIAHDGGLNDVVDWFPHGTLNDWKKKGWKEKSQWGFLNALPVNWKPVGENFCPGLMKDGKLVNEWSRFELSDKDRGIMV